MKKSDYLFLENDAGSENKEQGGEEELQSSDVDNSSDGDVGTNAPHHPSPTASSSWKVTLNLANYTTGVGFLATPFAVMKGGITALLAMCLIPFVYWYANNIIIECLYDQDKNLKQQRVRARSSWKQIGEVLSPKYGGASVVFLQFFILYLVSTSYLILCGSLMVHIVPSIPVTEAMWTCIAALTVLPTTFCKSYSELAWLSALGLIALSVTAAVVICHALEHINQWNLTSLLFWDSEGVLISLGIIVYSYAVFEMLPSVEENMADKSQLGRSMALTYVIVALIKIPFSLCAFLSFEFKVDEVLVNNLPPGPLHIAVVAGFIISFLLSYSLPLQPMFQFVEENEIFERLSSKIPHLFCFSMLRISLVVLTAIGAVLVPRFALLSSLDGNVISSILAFVIPCCVYLKLNWHRLKACQIVACLALLVWGIILFVFGGVFTIKALIQ